MLFVCYCIVTRNIFRVWLLSELTGTTLEQYSSQLSLTDMTLLDRESQIIYYKYKNEREKNKFSRI